ncbi:MAG: carboxypeptidase regulatory-like domain-containing protein [Gemmatimonadota bacterium]|nr:carboxypeptidase regulatory-like domain-containing protein [Gemmatimonadota bacterium]
MRTGMITRARRAATAVLAAAFGSMGAGDVAAQARVAVLSGVVTNLNGVPVARAEVWIVNTDLRAITNDSGVYEFLAAPVARVRVNVRRIGFEASEERVTLDGHKPRQLDFELKAIPELLDSVMVREAGGNGRMAEFWARRMSGNGAYITREEIDRRRPQHSSDLLRTVTGVKVIAGDGGLDRTVISMGRNPVFRGGANAVNMGAACRVTYYVDGSYVPPGTFHMDDMSPMAIEAVEVYRGPSETPAKLRQRDTACGVIVIWTRAPAPRPPG